MPAAGEVWQFEVRLRSAAGLLNPGGFDYQRWLFSKGIDGTAYIRQSQHNRRLQLASGWNIHHNREHLATAIERHCTDCPRAGLIKALALGFRGDIEESQAQLLRDSGTAHLLAISGLHIGMVALLFFALGSFVWKAGVLRNGINRLQFASSSALLASAMYAAMAGFSLPTVRALLMLLIVYLALQLRNRINLLHCLCLCVIIILLIDPLSVGSISFWLTFSALLVIAFAQFRLPSGLTWWRQLLALQLCFSILFLPVGIVAFGQVNPSALLANIVAIPLLSFVVLPLILLAVPLAAAGFTWSQWLLQLVDTLLGWILVWFEWLLQSGLGSFAVTSIPLMISVLLLPVGLLLLMPAALPGRSFALLLLLLPFVWSMPRLQQGEYQLTLLDVGMGTSLILQTRHHSLIYDFGPGNRWGYSAADWALLPYMRQQGIDEADLMVISHVDQDHSGGFHSLLADYSPEKLLSGTPRKLVRRFRLAYPVQSCHGYPDWHWDGVDFRFLSTQSDGGNSNNRSCVLQVIGHQRMLIAGDIETRQEAKLVLAFGDELAADVLLAPHHGSNTSSSAAFVASVQPRHVLFTLSADNRWGFPKPEVVARYRNIAARIYRSDRDGAIQMQSRQAGLRVKAHRIKGQRIWRDG